FLPATVFGTPTNAVLAAAMLQVLFVAGALLGFAMRVARRAGAPAPLGVAAGATACLLLAWQPGSFQWLTRVHPGGVALALGLAACALLVTGDGGSPSPRALRLSAAAAVITCWAKQVEVAVPAALVFIVWWAHGRAVAIRYLAWTAGLGTAV